MKHLLLLALGAIAAAAMVKASECGGILNCSGGSFHTPNYPYYFDAGSKCSWTIQAPAGSSINITFHDFDIYESEYCKKHHVKIIKDKRLLYFCGTTIPDPIHSTSNEVLVNFTHTGVSMFSTSKGFKASYVFGCNSTCMNTECGGNLTDLRGSFTSLNYPKPYPCNTECVWIIQSPADSRIRITFEDFDVQYETSCISDYIQVNGSNGRQIGKLLCGSTPPSPIHTMSSVVWVKFKSDHSSSGRGFKISYDTEYGGNLPKPTGYLTSLNYPKPYLCNTEYFWTLKSPAGSHIWITFDDFDVKYESSCNSDYLAILEEKFNMRQTSIYLCGSNPPSPIRTMSSVLLVKFKSGDNCSGRGFRAFYDFVFPITQTIKCGGNLTALSGYFKSFNYPNPYPCNIECVWTIQTPAGSRIRITFEAFDLKNEAGCISDYVVIRVNGPNGRQIGNHLCGSRSPSPIQTMSSVVWVKFKSSHRCSGRGFVISYDTECGGNLTAPTGYFTSVNYPEPYPCNIECVWTIQAPRGNHIWITFEDLDVTNESSCISDYIVILENRLRYPQAGIRLCGSTLPSPIVTMSNEVLVKFKSDNRCSGRGFNASYIVISTTQPPKHHISCDTEIGENVTTPTGYFTSLNYPQPYPCNTECVWTIEASPGSYIRIIFEDIDIRNDTTCFYDYVAILVKGPNFQMIGNRRCGTSVPPLIRTMSSIVWVKFKSYRNCFGRGFNVSYNIDF